MFTCTALATRAYIRMSVVLPLAGSVCTHLKVLYVHSCGFCEHARVNVKLLVICTVLGSVLIFKSWITCTYHIVGNFNFAEWLYLHCKRHSVTYVWTFQYVKCTSAYMYITGFAKIGPPKKYCYTVLICIITEIVKFYATLVTRILCYLCKSLNLVSTVQ